MIQTAIFFLFAIFLVIASIGVISVKNPVHSVFSLIVCFILTAGLFILIGAEYIALSLIIIYVGAIAVLFLFVVMMLDINFTILRQGWLNYMPFCLIIAFILAGDLYLLFDKSFRHPINLNHRTLPINGFVSLTNTEMIGKVLYTDYILPFQMAGLLLLVAMIGAIVLALRTRTNVKRQVISKQLERTKEDGLVLVKVKTGEGV
jgi:NADH-quinone oxidoreductase subunit J